MGELEPKVVPSARDILAQQPHLFKNRPQRSLSEVYAVLSREESYPGEKVQRVIENEVEKLVYFDQSRDPRSNVEVASFSTIGQDGLLESVLSFSGDGLPPAYVVWHYDSGTLNEIETHLLRGDEEVLSERLRLFGKERIYTNPENDFKNEHRYNDGETVTTTYEVGKGEGASTPITYITTKITTKNGLMTSYYKTMRSLRPGIDPWHREDKISTKHNQSGPGQGKASKVVARFREGSRDSIKHKYGHVYKNLQIGEGKILIISGINMDGGALFRWDSLLTQHPMVRKDPRFEPKDVTHYDFSLLYQDLVEGTFGIKIEDTSNDDGIVVKRVVQMPTLPKGKQIVITNPGPGYTISLEDISQN